MGALLFEPRVPRKGMPWRRCRELARHGVERRRYGSTGGGRQAADDQDRIRANYRGNYDRLVEVKRAYDPGNLFHQNQNISP